MYQSERSIFIQQAIQHENKHRIPGFSVLALVVIKVTRYIGYLIGELVGRVRIGKRGYCGAIL
ncbi:hypothetical protein EAI_08504 [Harpegnathos saltator]|uniref:Uncharacterized protein n=1 Tax=Harpegnathos saltator TaxID=610380 RepID=E2BEJ3_HARSA|nr:hypothetical protein EAI_08504 [Harpegnathos saltator]